VAAGLASDAAQEMKRVTAAHADDRVLAYRLAELYSDAGEPFRATNILLKSFRDVIRHGATGTPHRFWEMVFPFPYREIYEKEATRRNLDPNLLAGITRQESGFEPSIVSNAGAVGLMQLMPDEASRIAAAAGLPVPSRAELFDAATNIAMGAAEFRQKLDAMHGDTTLAIAAYNAGEPAVGRWTAATPVDDIDRFIESIPYAETKLYVKNVTRNRDEYRRIYGTAGNP
jgi:soluble lytic murein transglycosylase